MFVLCCDRRQNAVQSRQRNKYGRSTEYKKKSRRGHEVLCRVLCSKDKGTNQDDKGKESSTEKVQRENKRRTSERNLAGAMDICLL
jgi:hypothetical protein